MANRKMRLNAAKQERRAANNGESRVSRPTCNECGGKKVAEGVLLRVTPDDVEVVATADICAPPEKHEMN